MMVLRRFRIMQPVDEIVHCLLYFWRSIELQVHLKHNAIVNQSSIIVGGHFLARISSEVHELIFTNVLRNQGVARRLCLHAAHGIQQDEEGERGSMKFCHDFPGGLG
jgi:hypothetical protein